MIDVVEPKIVPIDKIVKTLMNYYGLDQQGFADKFRVDKSQVTRWLNNNQVPRGELFLRLRMEYDQVKDKVQPLLKELS